MGFVPTKESSGGTQILACGGARIGAVCGRPDADIQRFIFSVEAEWPDIDTIDVSTIRNSQGAFRPDM
jgi:hypothetical protein